ncbi:MAG: TRAFs-binding domain-containing protein [Methyloceanibacter sp.]
MEETEQLAPLCFVLMPFGKKMDAAGRVTNFDSVYDKVIAPAVARAGLEPIRADEEKIGGTIHKPMFERLMLCNYAVADITGANPNVYYELGIRHAMRPRSTVILFAAGTILPFDIALLRGISYQTNEQGVPSNPAACAAAIAKQLGAAKENPHDDSPLFQMLDYMPRHEVDHTKTDTFRDRFNYSKQFKDRLANALQQGEQAVKETIADPAFKNLHDLESGVVVDMFLTLRDVKAHKEMIDLYQRMPEPLQRARIVREQYGFALNREGRAQEATSVLKTVIEEFGPSSETNGLLGRVYKDQWVAAKKAGTGALQVRGLLKLAAETYLAGFQADWRDAYPGVNAVTLMELMDTPPAIQAEILPVVRFSAAQKAKASGDYWDYATLMEIAVLERDENGAMEQAEVALAKAQFCWHL